MSGGLVSYRRDGEIGLLTISNPPMNILTAEVRRDLAWALATVGSERGLRALILTGDGDRAFCAGADLREEGALTPETLRRFLVEDRETYDTLEALAVPVIAAVNGYCFGGGLELALACDIRLAVEGARFCAPGAKIGLVANTARLTRLLGEARAKELVLTSRVLSASEAERVGLVSEVVAAGQLMEAARRWADLIAANAPLAVAAAKRVIAGSGGDFEHALALELEAFAEMTATHDHRIAVEAFFAKHKPVFQGE
jgi:enoyl-CoA hydratase/carnithine racemase